MITLVLMGMFLYLCILELCLGYHTRQFVRDDAGIVAFGDGADVAVVIISD